MVYYAVTEFSRSVNWVLKAVTTTNRSIQRIYMAITKISNPALMVYTSIYVLLLLGPVGTFEGYVRCN